MNTLKNRLEAAVNRIIINTLGFTDVHTTLDHPTDGFFGDYTTNAALKVSGRLKQNAKDVAGRLLEVFAESAELKEIGVEKVEMAGPGFINFHLSVRQLVQEADTILLQKEEYGRSELFKGKKIMVEFAPPNTHKEMHIGHMRTLITGEALSRILSASGATVFRANYQGDIGPHVAKAIWGTQKLLKEKNMTWKKAEELSLSEKAHLLGLGYIEGNKGYEENKEEMDALNKKLYQRDPSVAGVYERSRNWSLEYYSGFYKRFYTAFNKLYFESEVFELGKKIVLDNVGKVFEESEGAIIFRGEPYGLHTRVFITADGNPTYEGKDMRLAQVQFGDFPFDKCVHVVANEQTGYFKVIIKALELIDPKFIGREAHLPMGMVQLTGQKISSRTGVLVTVDGLLDDVKILLRDLIKVDLPVPEREKVLESTTVAAVKYSVLKTAPTMNSTFDLEKSVALDGNSGPYLQYTYARAKSVLRKSETHAPRHSGPRPGIQDQGSLDPLADLAAAGQARNGQATSPSGMTRGGSSVEENISYLTKEELSLLRILYRFPEVVEDAAAKYEPHLIANYLFDLAQKFNQFYNNVRILEDKSEIRNPNIETNHKSKKDPGVASPHVEAGQDDVIKAFEARPESVSNFDISASDFRLSLTMAAAQIIKNGLYLLGIEAPERM